MPPGYRYYGKLTFGISDVAPQPSTSNFDEVLDSLINRGGRLTAAEQAQAILEFQSLPPAQRSDPSLLLRMAALGIPVVQQNIGSSGAGAVATSAIGADEVQRALGAAGFIQGPVGVAANALNAAIFAFRGDFANAALAGVAVIPFEKLLAAAGGKALGFLANHGDEVVETAKPLTMSVEEAIEHGLTERDAGWLTRGLHELEDHHPLMRGEKFRDFWKARGFSNAEVEGFIKTLDKDIHRAIEESGYWRDQVLERIAAQELAEGRLLDKSEVLSIVNNLLNELPKP